MLAQPALQRTPAAFAAASSLDAYFARGPNGTPSFDIMTDEGRTCCSQPLDHADGRSVARSQRASSDPAAEPLRTASLSSYFGIKPLDYEPNPFEQSFSVDPKAARGAQSPRRARSTSPFGGFARTPGGSALGGHGGAGHHGGGGAQGPKLPSVASLASPAHPGPGHMPAHLAWAGLDPTTSLRTGPLSPAMLSGPASGASHGAAGGLFDPSNMRTGLTPMPLGSHGNGYVPQSPNTALYAMMNDHRGEAPTGQSAISRLGARSESAPHFDSSFAASRDVKPNVGASGSYFATQGVPRPFSLNDRAMIGSQAPATNGVPAVAPGKLRQAVSHPGPPTVPPRNIAPQFTHHNPLYLLSQAQQEITGAGVPDDTILAAGALSALTAAAAQSPYPPSLAPPSHAYANAQPAAPAPAPAPPKAAKKTGGRKRKSDVVDDLAVPEPVAAPPAKRGRAAKKRAKKGDDDEDDDDAMDYQDNVSVGSGGKPKGRASTGDKAETEEEKRRNFLERNRQGPSVSSLRFADICSRAQVPSAQEGVVAVAPVQGRVPQRRQRGPPEHRHLAPRRGLGPARRPRRPSELRHLDLGQHVWHLPASAAPDRRLVRRLGQLIPSVHVAMLSSSYVDCSCPRLRLVMIAVAIELRTSVNRGRISAVAGRNDRGSLLPERETVSKRKDDLARRFGAHAILCA